ncbi:MAG TPA: hypothetical protein VNH21_16190 [Steroidobacteraceae bacterium]|nr:hypothetical protein [Steroidobacteraceae bacterium]
MRIEFLKMQGLGNDFLVFDAPAAADSLDGGKLRALADRRTGIGFDQALMLESPRDASNRVFYRVFNSDGSEAEQCGNGARCIAALLYERAPQLGRSFAMESSGGIVHARIGEDGMVSVDMGVPNFDPRALPMDAADADADADGDADADAAPAGVAWAITVMPSLTFCRPSTTTRSPAARPSPMM